MIEIINQTDFKFSQKKFLEIGEKILAKHQSEDFYFSLIIVSAKRIKELNRQYRQKNKPTDVLSFENKKEKGFHQDKNLLGEILICPEIVSRNAKRKKASFEQELLLVYIHGILHLLGFDHEKTKREALKMEKLQDDYVKKFLALFNRG